MYIQDIIYDHNLTELELTILENIEQQILGNGKLTIRHIASMSFTSTTTIYKLAKKLGFDGYSEMIFSLKTQLATNNSQSNFDSLTSLINNYSKDLINSYLNLLIKYKYQRISVLGLGYSGIACDYISRKLSLYGYITYNGAFLDIMLTRTKNPILLFAISKSGETEDVIRIVKRARKHNVKVIAFTSDSVSRIVDNADLTFIINSGNQSSPFNDVDTFCGKTILAFEYLMQLYKYKMASS